MRARINRLHVLAVTEERPFGIDLATTDGLTVVRADNSMGKSTVANAILYALGGEGMLSPRWDLPLKYCLYDHLVDDAGEHHRVLESHVTLELVDWKGRGLSVRRHVESSQFQHDLVQLWDGLVLTEPAAARRRPDAFVRTGGSATRPSGYHTQLAEFFGWDLPDVTRYDGTTSPLYLQLLLPFSFVEQQRGWAGVRANVPRFLQVRDPDRRALEFLLGLDADHRARRREALQAEEGSIRRRWGERVAEFQGSLRNAAVSIKELPTQPAVAWPPSPPPALEVYEGDTWRSVGDALASLRGRRRELSEREIPTVEATAAAVEAQLAQLDARHRSLAAAHAQLVREVDADAAGLRRIDERLAALDTDRARHQDALRIKDLGGTPAAALSDGRCPTCDQGWPEHLLGGSSDEPVMSFTEHLELIEQERRALRLLRQGAEAESRERTTRERALRETLAEVRADIRAHRSTLISDGKRPSAAAVRERLIVDDRIERLEDLDFELTRIVEDLAVLSVDFRRIRSELADLAEGKVSEHDERILSTFEGSFRSQLDAYGFRSIGEVTMARTTYLPEREGFDLTHEVSASDTIRLVWAYLLGMLETDREHGTNHLGILVLDEPGQQDIEDASLRSFFARAAALRGTGRQVLVTVTRPLERVESAALDQATLIDYGERQHVLQPRDG